MSMDKAQALWQLTRMDRPIGSLLLMWPTLWALVIAGNGLPHAGVAFVFIMGVFLMRSAGCVINDYADRNFDGHVKRTKNRPLPSGRVTPKEALVLFFILAGASFFLVLTMNTLTIKLSFIGIMLAAAYPFMKRYTNLPQLILGMAFSWSIVMAWAAQSGELPAQAWLLFLINILWTVAYDTEYAMVDRDDDLKIGIKSTAILFGRFDKLIIGILQLAVILLFIGLGAWLDLSSVFYWCLLVVAGLFVYQQYLIHSRERDACFQAFLSNNYVGMIVFIGLLANYLLV